MVHPERTLPEASYLMVSVPELTGLRECAVFLLYADKFKQWNLDRGGGVLNFDEQCKTYPADDLNTFIGFIESKLLDSKTGAFVAMDFPAFNAMKKVQEQRNLFNPDKMLWKHGVFVQKKAN